jgi:cobaltochelatase CobS
MQEISGKVFGLSESRKIASFDGKDLEGYVPNVDKDYIFDEATTTAVLAGFEHNKRVLLTGLHGSGKSSHIEQVAAQLNWPVIRINLDGHIGRIDLIGRDTIVLENGQQITKFQEGLLPFAMRQGIALVLDEYDAGRPDVMFVMQRVLEGDGSLTLLEKNTIIRPHKNFRIFATSNTVGMGDDNNLYHGTNLINQGQMDRWNIVASVPYIEAEKEVAILVAKTGVDKKLANYIVSLANLTRASFAAGDISSLMSPRTTLSFADNFKIFGDTNTAFKLAFYNKVDSSEKAVVAEFYKKCFAESL